MILIDRDADLIEASRPELKFDVKMRARQVLYRKLARTGGWKILDNSGDLDDTKRNFSEWLTDQGY